MSETFFSVPLPKELWGWLFRLLSSPYWLYLNRLLGDHFLLLAHPGRTSGGLHQTACFLEFEFNPADRELLLKERNNL